MNDDSYIYSISGRNAGEKFDIKSKINKMKGIKKIKFVRDYYTPDPEWNNTSDNNIDYIDLFQENKNDKEFKNGNNSIENKIINLLKNNLYNDKIENNKDNKDNKNNKNVKNKMDAKESKVYKFNRNVNTKINNKNNIKNHPKNNNNLKNNENSKTNIQNNKNKKDTKGTKDNKDKEKNFYNDFIKMLKENVNKKNNLKSLNKKDLKRIKYESIIDRYKYHKLHMAKLAKYKKIGLLQKINKVQNAVYTPNFDYISKRIITGPKWKKLTGRNQKIKRDNHSCENFMRNYAQDSFFKEGKGFIIMSKQTQRNGFPISNNLRERYEKKFTPLNNKLNSRKVKKHISFNIKENKNNDTNLFKKRIKLNLKNIRKLKEYKSVPDFNRYLSREQRNKKIKNIYNGDNLLYPNYNYIEEKVKMMVLYNNKKNYIPNKNEFEGIHQNEFYDTNKIFNILKGNKTSVPKFDKMTSRPYDKILPVFMKGIHSRFISSEVTDKTLEMNNYANTNFFDFNKTYNKKSFNKYVNLCFLKSDYIQPENIQNKSEFIVLSRNINNLNLDKNNIEQFLENVKMNKFDKITMKSVKYNHNKKNYNF